MKASVETEKFTRALKDYSARMQKGMGSVVREQARFLAERLRQLTPPKSRAQGKNRVEGDVKKVFLGNAWFEEKFAFRNEKVKARIVGLIQKQDVQGLNEMFSRSPKLDRLRVEGFNKARHEQGRDSRGRVKYRQPVSFPVNSQGDVAAYVKRRQKAVGLVKGGWGRAVVQLGGKSASWVNRKSGGARDYSSYKENPRVILFNNATYADALCNRLGIVGKALVGRAQAMAKSVDKLLGESASFSGF